MLAEGQEILESRFKIIKKLGSGAFGEIFKGKSKETGAIKRKVAKIGKIFQTYMIFHLVEKKKTGEFYAAKIVSNTTLAA